MKKIDPFLGERFDDHYGSNPIRILDAGAADQVFNPFEDEPFRRTEVLGFEPTPISYEVLIERYAGHPRVQVVQAGLSSRSGQMEFYVHRKSPTLSSLDRDFHRDDEAVERCMIDVHALDDIIPRSYASPDFVKMDTEGHELQIVLGGQRVFTEDVVAVYTEFEFERGEDMGCAFRGLDGALVDCGFILFDIQIDRGAMRNHGGKKDRIFGGNALYYKDVYRYDDEVLTAATAEHRRQKCLPSSHR